MKKTIMVAIILSLGVAYSSCNLGTSSDDETFQFSRLIPSAVGNYWIYTDSNLTQFDTTSIISVYNTEGYTWWKLNNRSFTMEEFSSEFAVRGDTILGRWAPKGGSTQIGWIFLPPAYTPFAYPFFRGDVGHYRRVTQHHEPITVPAGTFNMFFTYVENLPFERDSIIIVPNVGVVARIFTGRKYPDRPAFVKKHFLKTYCLF